MRTSLVIGAVIAAATATQLHSQDESPRRTATDDQRVYEEVVVTAEKVSQSAQDAPITLTVLGETQLRERGAQSFSDYMPSVPALSFQQLAPGEQRILLRGVSDGVGLGTRGDTQNTTGIYIDDMVVSNNETAPDLNLFDVARVEVLKGPQGTLYGDGSVGGLVRVLTNKADPTTFAATVEGSIGFVNQGGGDYALNGMVNIPLVQDRLALRLVGQYRTMDGFIDDVRRGIKDVNDLEQRGARTSLRWQPTESFNLTLAALYQQSELGSNNDANILLGDLKRATQFAEPVSTDFRLYNLTAEWDLGWSTVLSSTSHARFIHDSDVDFTDLFGQLLAPLPALDSFAELGQDGKSYSQELRLSSPADRRLRWIGGLYYFKSDEHSYEHDVSFGLFDLFEEIGIPVRGTPLDVGEDVLFTDQFEHFRRQFAAFGEVSYELGERLTATMGARWFRDELTDHDNAGGVSLFAPPFDLTKATTEDGDVFRFRLAVEPMDDVLLYGVASQGYRTGGLNPLNPATVNDPTFPPAFDPDTLWNYELGAKTQWLDRHLTVNGALFFIDWDNVQVQIPLPSGFSVIGNAGAARIRGVEAEAYFTPIQGLDLGLTGSYIDAELRADLAGDDGELVGRKGDRLTGVPRSQGGAYAQYRFPLPGMAQGVARVDLQRVGKIQRYFGSDRFAYGDYQLLDLRLGVERDNLSVVLFAKNLADERAEFFHGQQGNSAPPTREDIYVAQPRTVGVTVSRSF